MHILTISAGAHCFLNRWKNVCNVCRSSVSAAGGKTTVLTLRKSFRRDLKIRFYEHDLYVSHEPNNSELL